MKKISLTAESLDSQLLDMSVPDILQAAIQMTAILHGVHANVIRRSSPCSNDCEVANEIINLMRETQAAIFKMSGELKKRGESERAEEIETYLKMFGREIEKEHEAIQINRKEKKEVFH